MSRPTTAQITTAVKALSTAPITNRRIADVFAELMPAGHTLTIQEPHLSIPRRWVVSGLNQDATTWQQAEPVTPGKGREIITRLINAAWNHAGTDSRTVADSRRHVAANPLPVCPECGRTVLPAEAAVSSHHGHHRDCC